MPIIAARRSSPASVTGLTGDLSPLKRKLRSGVLGVTIPDLSIELTESSPGKWKSPRRCLIDSPQANTPLKETEKDLAYKELKLRKSPVKKNLSDCFHDKPTWNPRDMEQLNAVKEALHVSFAPSTILCREEEQDRVLEFCKQCIKEEKAGSLYVCGCPGTGKSLSMEKVKEALSVWGKEEGFAKPDVISFNCTSLTNTSEIFSKIPGNNSLKKKSKGAASPLKTLQTIYCQKQHSSGTKMMLIIADELDYLITRDRAVLHDLFMLTTFPFSRCILIGIANAIDLADRFLPKLQSMNCKPTVITFRSYSKDQIMMILRQRLMALPCVVFQPQALELCARRVAAASGDMRKALWICRSAIDILEFEIRDSIDILNQSSIDLPLSTNQIAANGSKLAKQNDDMVRVDHMALALSKAYRSPVVDTIQSLPQHQQILLCSGVKLFRGGKKGSTIGELNKHYNDFCKWTSIPPVGMVELSSMCRVLADQGLFKLGQSREDKLRKVALKVDETDVTFALQGVRFFRNCLQL